MEKLASGRHNCGCSSIFSQKETFRLENPRAERPVACETASFFFQLVNKSLQKQKMMESYVSKCAKRGGSRQGWVLDLARAKVIDGNGIGQCAGLRLTSL